MTDKQLKKLKRSELLELLVEQADEMDEIRRQLTQAQEDLQRRDLSIQQAGSIAQAALQINDVFVAADRAAQDYLNNVQNLQTQQKSRLAEANEKADALLTATRQKCRELERETWLRCRERLIALGEPADAIPEEPPQEPEL